MSSSAHHDFGPGIKFSSIFPYHHIPLEVVPFSGGSNRFFFGAAAVFAVMSTLLIVSPDFLSTSLMMLGVVPAAGYSLIVMMLPGIRTARVKETIRPVICDHARWTLERTAGGDARRGSDSAAPSLSEKIDAAINAEFFGIANTATGDGSQQRSVGFTENMSAADIKWIQRYYDKALEHEAQMRIKALRAQQDREQSQAVKEVDSIGGATSYRARSLREKEKALIELSEQE